MEPVLNTIWEVAFAILMGSLLVGAFLYSQFVRILRARHPDVWKSLGSPTLVTHNTLRNFRSMSRFLLEKHYFSLDDEELNRIAKRLQLLRRVGGIATLLAFGVFLVIVILG